MFILSCSLPMAGAAHAVQWAQSYGGTGLDIANSVQPTPDSGYVVAGSTDSFGAGSVAAWVLKLDAGGNIVWQKTYRGAGSDYATSAQPTADGGYIVAGYTSLRAGDFDVWVLKLDASGNIVWQRAYGGNFVETTHNVQATADGGYVVAASTLSFGAGNCDIWILKLDASGNIIWQKTYGGIPLDGASAVQPTADGGYIVAGQTASFRAGTGDWWVLKLDASGNVTWQKAYGNGFGGQAWSVQPTPDGGYIVAGTTTSTGAGREDVWVLKLDTSGNVTWEKTYGGTGIDVAYSLQLSPDGGYVVAGLTDSFGAGRSDAWLLKLDASGSVIWQKTFGGTGTDVAFSVQTATDGGYVVAGYSDSFGTGTNDAWVLKLDANGAIIGCANMGTSNAIPVGSNAIAGNSVATVAASSAATVSTMVTPGNSTASPLRQCYYADPVIPTLSEWGMILMSGLLVLCGALMMRRGRRECIA